MMTNLLSLDFCHVPQALKINKKTPQIQLVKCHKQSPISVQNCVISVDRKDWLQKEAGAYRTKNLSFENETETV